MRRLPAAVIALTAAAALAVYVLPAIAAGPRVFRVHAKTVRAGQQIKVSGGGCGSQALVRIYLHGIEIDTDRADRSGAFNDLVVIPSSVDPGKASIKAGCSGYRVGKILQITILGSRFSVSPQTVEAGENVRVSGSLCRPNSFVTIKLDGGNIDTDRTDSRGRFSESVRIPPDTEVGAHSISARCHGALVGSILIDVTPAYPSPRNLLTTDRTAVPAGQVVTVSGTKCPTGRPMAKLDGTPVNLANRNVDGKGFTATATIPATATPGKHTLWAGCDAGSSGSTELQVLEAAQPAAARMAFGPQPVNDLALWAALFSGVAILVASIGFTTRRRRS
jgi:hypothetical protein